MNASNSSDKDFAWLLAQFTEIIDVLVLVVFAVTFTIVLWQIINAWIIHGGNAMKVEEANKTIFIGVVVLVIMASVWGIVALLRSSFM